MTVVNLALTELDGTIREYPACRVPKGCKCISNWSLPTSNFKM